jgi:uncharacterized protein (TIGR04206 family)
VRGSRSENSSTRRRVLAVCLLGLLPWTVIIAGQEATFVFAFGLVNTNPFHLTDLYSYLFIYTAGLPKRLQAWPAGVLLYAGALVSTLIGLVNREDPRLTGGLLFFAGVSHAQVTFGLYRAYGFGASGTLVLPVGAVATWAAVWWVFWPAMKERGLGPLD